jgi:DNA repair exonuclease SbcCD nuclease subunit
VRVAAIGDAHLGRAYYPFTTPEGLNQRERDFEESFEAATEAALAESPDLVVWLGDIFDHPRPTYRSFRVAQRGLARVREHGIKVVVISGNHDTPRLPGTGSPYSALADAFPELCFAHRLRYERFELPGLVVHCVPQMLTVDATLEALDEADRSRSSDRVNLLLTHPRVTQVEPSYADINEIEVDAQALRSDLVLLGHYHCFTTVTQHMWYAGSTDTFSFADDPDRAKGVVVLDTDTAECRHVVVPGRRLVTLESLQAKGIGPRELQQRVLERVARAPEGSVARLFVDDVDPEAYRLLDLEAVREAHRQALHCKLEPTFAGVADRVELPELDTMPAWWARFVAAQDLTGYDRERVERMGRDHIARAVESAG